MRRVLVVGRAGSVWDDVRAARALCAFDECVLVNATGCDWTGEIHHWATFHVAALVDIWVPRRRDLGLPPARNYWTSTYHGAALGQRIAASHGIELRRVECSGGSSGLIGAKVALRVGDRAVLAGIPLSDEAGHYDQPGDWDEALKYRAAWEEVRGELEGRVRSMSGWTRELLGEPTREWLAGEAG